jgi:hypothetical protein
MICSLGMKLETVFSPNLLPKFETTCGDSPLAEDSSSSYLKIEGRGLKLLPPLYDCAGE